MAIMERDIVMTGEDDSGQPTIDLPVTRLGNVEGGADVKKAPEAGDFIPVIDGADGGKMKKTPAETFQRELSEEDLPIHTHKEYAPKDSPVFTGSISMGRKAGTDVGDGSVAEGKDTAATGLRSHAEGFLTMASGIDSHAEGYQTQATNVYDHAEGNYAIASGGISHAEGSQTEASGSASHAEGHQSAAKGDMSHAEGYKTAAGGEGSHAEGHTTVASGLSSHAEGRGSTASGTNSHAEGQLTLASGTDSHAAGCGTIASAYTQYVIGEYNVEYTGHNLEGAVDTNYSCVDARFIIGKGRAGDSRANAFRVGNAGVWAAGNYNASGADYAELFEWLDGNPEGEDRTGRFVTLDGEKIRLAGPGDDFILGVISGAPSVVGDVYDDQWKGMYLYDVFGRPVYENVEIPEELDVSGEVIVPARVERRQKLNPDYDPARKYVPRSERPEWGCVGMMGKLVMVDDGTCQVNGWCAPGEGGAATASGTRTKYRVMARLDSTHIRVLIL